MQRPGNLCVLFILQGYSLQFVFLLELVLRSCGVIHFAEGYLRFLFVLRGVFVAVCSSIGLCDHVVYSAL